MKLPHSFNVTTALYILDTSSVINLVLSGYAVEIISALPGQFVIPECIHLIILKEAALKSRYESIIRPLSESNKLNVIPLADNKEDIFLSLITGSNLESLSDDEASAIAIAAIAQGMLITSDLKVRTVCSKKHPDIQLVDFIDMLHYVHDSKLIGKNEFLAMIENLQVFTNISRLVFAAN